MAGLGGVVGQACELVGGLVTADICVVADEGELPKWFIGKMGVLEGGTYVDNVVMVARKTNAIRSSRLHLHFLRNMVVLESIEVGCSRLVGERDEVQSDAP
jgi:hypothetical protein